MPTYTVKSSNIKLDNKKKKKIAEGITEVHKKVTGANSYFVLVRILVRKASLNHEISSYKVYNYALWSELRMR